MPAPTVGIDIGIDRRRRARRRIALGAIAAISIVAPAAVLSTRDRDPLVRQLSREVERGAIHTTVQFSIATAHSDCPPADGPFEPGTDTACALGFTARSVDQHVIEVERQALAAAHRAVDPSGMHVEALVGLLWFPGQGKVLDASISSLEMLTRISEDATSAWTDLAAAHLLSARDRGSAAELVQALDAAERARARSSPAPAAAFDAALASELLGLDDDARRGWQAYLATDSTSAWAAEARQHVRGVDARRDSANVPDDEHVAALVALAHHDPGSARVYGWEHVLGDWGRATLSGDAATARDALTAAESIGDALASDSGDHSLLDATRAIQRTMHGSASRRRLALAHASYDSARAAFTSARQADASRLFERARSDGVLSAPLEAWATLGRGMALVMRDSARPGEALLMTARNEAKDRYPALAARAAWGLGTTSLKTNRIGDGIRYMEVAASLFARIRERENLGAVEELRAEALFAIRDDSTGYRTLRRALLHLRESPRSVWRHNALYVLAKAATADGLDAAASAIEDEDAAVALAGGSPVVRLESGLERARTLWRDGRKQAATLELSRVQDMLAQPDLDPELRHRFSADFRFVQATGPLSSRPAMARNALDTVISFFEPSSNAEKLIPALVARATASSALGQIDDAERDLDHAASLVVRRRAGPLASVQRASVTAAVGSLFDELMLLRARRGRVVAALRAVEEGRATFDSDTATTALDSAALVRSSSNGLVVDYRLIGDTLFVWTIGPTGIRLRRRQADSTQLVRMVERLRVRSENDGGSAGSPIPDELTRLYDLLVRPIAGELGAAGSLVSIIPDPAVAGVPFAGLYDESHRRYLVEDHTLRISSRLRDAMRPTSAAPLERGALFVGRDTLDRATFPLLEPLTSAEREARELGSMFVGAKVLAGQQATRDVVVAALGSATVFHFAGHAVFDERHPDRSFLGVPPNGLTAAELSTLDLHRLRLVALSTCESVRSVTGPPTGLASLADAFRAAGATGIVGSLWRVDDQRASAIMQGFFEQYRKSNDPAAALSVVQRKLLHGGDRGLANPAVWAAFEFTGY